MTDRPSRPKLSLFGAKPPRPAPETPVATTLVVTERRTPEAVR